MYLNDAAEFLIQQITVCNWSHFASVNDSRVERWRFDVITPAYGTQGQRLEALLSKTPHVKKPSVAESDLKQDRRELYPDRKP